MSCQCTIEAVPTSETPNRDYRIANGCEPRTYEICGLSSRPQRGESGARGPSERESGERTRDAMTVEYSACAYIVKFSSDRAQGEARRFFSFSRFSAPSPAAPPRPRVAVPDPVPRPVRGPARRSRSDRIGDRMRDAAPAHDPRNYRTITLLYKGWSVCFERPPRKCSPHSPKSESTIA